MIIAAIHFRDHGGVRTVGILARTEHIEITQAHTAKAISTREHIAVQFIDEFRDGIRRQGFADLVLLLRQVGMIAIRRTGRCIDERLHLRIARRIPSTFKNPSMLTALVVAGSLSERGTEPNAA